MTCFCRVLVALALLACGKKPAPPAPDANAPVPLTTAPTLNVPPNYKPPPVVFDGPMISKQKLPAGRFRKVFGLFHYGCALAIDGHIACWSESEKLPFDVPQETFRDLAWDRSRGCAIKTTGEMVCFGDAKMIALPAALAGRFTKVTVAGSPCALRDDGLPVCSPARAHRLGETTPKTKLIDLSCSVNVCCGLDAEGRAICWGEDSPLLHPPPGPFTKLSLAYSSKACALTSAGAIVCWGDPENLKKPPPEGSFTAIEVQMGQACATARDGSVKCWGDIHAKPVELPFKVRPGTAPNYDCAIAPSDELHCFGRDWFGPTPAGSFIAIEGGKRGICAIRADGALACFGDGETVKDAPNGEIFRQVSVGTWHSCGLRAGGDIACWGSDFRRSLAAPNGTFREVTADVVSCAVEVSGAVKCWGIERGDPPRGELHHISAGNAFTCGLTPRGVVRCWMADEYLAGRTERTTPTEEGFIDVWAGYEHQCAMKKDKHIVCWGRDVQGETKPPNEAFLHIALGEKRSCGLTEAGKAICWGGKPAAPPDGPFTQIAITGNTDQNEPTFVCAIRKDDGKLACWPY